MKRMGLYDYGIYQVIKRNARILSDKIALVFGDQKISYKHFLENVDRLACGLIGAGLQRGDRIGILALNSLEYVYLYGAASKIGAIMLPINWRLNPQEVEYIISDGSPKIIFAGSEFQTVIAPLISKFSFIEKCYGIGQTEGNFPAFNELMGNNGNCPDLNANSDDPYVIIHTAAVSGKPRGATLSQRGLLISSLQLMYCLNLTKQDCNLCILPLFHYGALGTTLSVMQAGGANIILPKFDSEQALKHIREDKVTLFAEFPPILTTLLDRTKGANYDLSSLRAVAGLDQLATIKRFEEMTGGTFWAFYGQTETSGLVTLSPYFEKPGSAGAPGFMAEVEIMDDYGHILGKDKVGEIVVRGPTVFKGYWNLKGDNEYTFRDGWHHSGDMGSFDSEGYLWYKGRKSEKELIKPGGENVYPAEIETAILQHPLVDEVAVIGVPDQQWGEAIKAICTLKKGESLNENELIEFVAARIAHYKKPKYVVFVSKLPKTADGLIDREKVKAEFGTY
jgi:long-chain acyl-CoA synthetase